MKYALVGCEESQAICLELRALGIKAFSCDIIDCSGPHPEWHLKMHVFDAILLRKWDLIILHPPCTALANSGNRTYAPGKPKYEERLRSAKWTESLWDIATRACPRVMLENPMGSLSSLTLMPKPQYVEPFYFGDPYRKKTGLWLHGLPKLRYILSDDMFHQKTTVEPEEYEYNSKRTKSGKSKYSAFGKLGKGKGKERSKTFPGIAKAIATQYGNLILNQ